MKRYEKEQAKIKQLSATAERMHGWGMGAAKLQKRANAMDKRIERMHQTDRPVKDKKLGIRFGEEDFFGDEVLTVKDLSKAYEGRALFRDVELKVKGGERIALIGPNGAGKTTLLRILLGEERPDGGKLRFGPTVKTGYLPQQVEFSHPERNLVDTMLYELSCSTQEARDRLGAFRFRGEDVFKEVSQLSGGERSRLRLCMLMDEKINLLVLDEPTNHLDLPSREWIEEAVADYEGTLIFVSHDRYFIERFASRVWELRDGVLLDVPGGFEAYRRARERNLSLPGGVKREAKPRREGREKKNVRNAGRQLAALEREIASREADLDTLEQQMQEVSCDYVRLGELFPKKESLAAELEDLYDRWEGMAGEGEAQK
jgi:ATPase subunit of ABC transporter with duplicated ATPase domains